MTKSQLLDHLVRIAPSGYGQWLITMKYRGKDVTFHYTDSTVIDAIKSDEPVCGTTPKQALEVLLFRAKCIMDCYR